MTDHSRGALNLAPWTEPFTEKMMDRIQEDMVMMQNSERWPPGQGYLWLKSQPWITERDGRSSHAHLNDPTDPTVLVLAESGRVTEVKKYISFLQLAKFWSVD